MYWYDYILPRGHTKFLIINCSNVIFQKITFKLDNDFYQEIEFATTINIHHPKKKKKKNAIFTNTKKEKKKNFFFNYVKHIYKGTIKNNLIRWRKIIKFWRLSKSKNKLNATCFKT
jgi:hypothetical protein